MHAHISSDDFTGRVNYAARVIANGRQTSRTFDSCFENYDGNAVAAALMRRAEKNERLRTNLPRYISLELATQNFEEYRGKDLKEVSRLLRLAGRWESHLMLRNGPISELEAMAGIQDREAFWKPFAKLDNYLDAGIAQLKRLIVAKKVAEGVEP
jgi:hypothetical protein